MTAFPETVERVGIVGAGVIGASWASLFLAAGKEVDLFDPAPNAEVDTQRYIERAWPDLLQLGLVREGSAPERIRFVDEAASAVAEVQFVQESVPERLDVKHEIYGQIEAALPPDAVVATSSSGLLLSDLQDSWRDPSRIILGHPFNPPHLVPLVELLGNERTVPGALDFAQAFYEGCGKVTIRVNKEVPGHVANRLQAALWREAIDLVLQGVASVEDVDKAVTAGPGLRWSVMGPHMLFSLGSGGAGMKGFCARYGESFHRWWDSMNAPRLDEEAGRTLSAGVAKEERGRSFAELAAERDRKLIAAQRALS